MFCPGVKSCQSDGREDWSKQSSLWRSIIPSRLHLPGFNSMNVCYEMGILKSFPEVCGGVTWDMGSWWEVSVWGLCWHQVNVGVKAPWQGPESGPKPLEWRLQYLWRARHSEHATTLREPWRALVTMSHSESPGHHVTSIVTPCLMCDDKKVNLFCQPSVPHHSPLCCDWDDSQYP